MKIAKLYKRFSNMFKDFCIEVVYSTKQTLKYLLGNPKDEIGNIEYEISCNGKYYGKS